MYPSPFAQMAALLPSKPKVTTSPVVASIPHGGSNTAVQVTTADHVASKQDPLVTFAKNQARLEAKDGLKNRVKGMDLKLDVSFATEEFETRSNSDESVWSVFCNDGYESSFSLDCDSNGGDEEGDKVEDKGKKVISSGEEVEVEVNAIDGNNDSDTDSNTDSAVSSECDWVPRSTLVGPINASKYGSVVAQIKAQLEVSKKYEAEEWVVVQGKGWMKKHTALSTVGVSKSTDFDGEMVWKRVKRTSKMSAQGSPARLI